MRELENLIVLVITSINAVKTHQEKENRYRIKNKEGQDVYFAAESKLSSLPEN